MFLFAKEKKVVNLISSHLNKVRDCLQLTCQTVNSYFEHNIKEAKKLALQVDGTESEADEIRRAITDLLFGGAFLPMLRQDIHSLVSQMDDVANAAESACDFLLGERPVIPEIYCEEMLLIYHKTIDQFELMLAAITELLEKSNPDTQTIREHYRKIGIIESEIDQIEWHLTREIFRSDLELAHKIHLRTWLRLSAQLSDQIENLSDTLNLVVLKAQI